VTQGCQTFQTIEAGGSGKMSCAAHPLVKSEAWNGQTTVRDHGAVERWRPAGQIMRGGWRWLHGPGSAGAEYSAPDIAKKRPSQRVRVALNR
jgi:hypothetical protein